MRQADTTPVSRIMSTDVITVSTDTPLQAVCQLFLQKNISGAPVIDYHGNQVGVVSKTDLVGAYHERGGKKEGSTQNIDHQEAIRLGSTEGFHSKVMTVGEIMTPVTYRIMSTTVVAQAAALMAFENVHRVPVINEAGAVVGLLSSMDILRWIAEQEGYLRQRHPEVSAHP